MKIILNEAKKKELEAQHKTERDKRVAFQIIKPETSI
jgi:hypothetical protein